MKPSHLRGQRAVPCLCVFTLEFALQLMKKHGKTSVRVIVIWSHFTGSLDKSVHLGLPWIALGDLGQPLQSISAELPIYGVPHTSFELKLLVKVLMWSEWNSQILMNVYVTNVPRHTGSKEKAFELITTCFLIWESAADLQIRHAKSITELMSCLYSRSLFHF